MFQYSNTASLGKILIKCVGVECSCTSLQPLFSAFTSNDFVEYGRVPAVSQDLEGREEVMLIRQ